MKFRMTPGPFQRSGRTTHSIMLELFCVLSFVFVYSTIFYFARAGAHYGLRVILIGVLSIIGSLAVDVITALAYKKKGKEIWQYILHSYSYITGLIFALTLPAGTSFFAVLIGSAFATFIGKVVFGGFGYNIVNPAAVGRIFVAVSFGLAVPNVPGLVDATTGASLTNAINWMTGAFSNNKALSDFFLGNYIGAIGETHTYILIICGAYLVYRGICDYRQGLTYVVATFIITFFLGMLLGVANPLQYALLHLSAGGLMFAAVFMVSDPVTGPTGPLGKVIYGIGLAFLTVLIRLCGNMNEGVIFSLVLMNLLVPLIEHVIKGKSTDNLARRWGVVVGMLVVSVFLIYGISLLGGAA